MKNFKKLILVLAVLALLVSSFAVMIVTADDTPAYTGNLAEARKKFAAAEAKKDTGALLEYHNPMKDVHTYLNSKPINPETEGYDEFIAELKGATLTLLNRWYYTVIHTHYEDAPDGSYSAGDKKNENYSKETKLGDINSAYELIDVAADIVSGTPDPDGDGMFFAYDDLEPLFEQEYYNVVKVYADAAVSSFNAGEIPKDQTTDFAIAYNQLARRPVHSSIEGSAELTEAVNTLSVQISETIYENTVKLKNAYILALEELAAANPEDDDIGKKQEAVVTATANYRKALETTELPVLIKHMFTYPILTYPEDTGAYADLKARFDEIDGKTDVFEVDRLKFLFVDYENIAEAGCVNPGTANQTALGKIQVLLNDAVIADDAEDYAEFLRDYTEAKAKEDAAMEKRRVDLDKQNSFANYGFSTIASDTFKNSVWSIVHGSTGCTEAISKTDSENNKYMSVVANKSSGGAAPYSYKTLNDLSRGLVMQFDLMLEGLNGGHYNNTSINFRNGSTSGLPFPQIFALSYDSANNSITATNENGAKVTNVACEGVWFNVMITFDPDTFTGEFYINYEKMFDIDYEADQGGSIVEFRFQFGTFNQVTNFDNYIVYQGTRYRDLDKMEIDLHEQFKLYSEYFVDTDILPKVRNEAYIAAKALVSDIEDICENNPDGLLPEEIDYLRELLQTIAVYNYKEEIEIPAKAANLEAVKNLVEALLAIEQKSTNVDELTAAAKTIDKYIAENGEFIDKMNIEFIYAEQDLKEVKENIIKLENVVVFAKSLTQFTRATSLASMRKYALTAQEIYELAEYKKAENRDFVKADPVIVAAEKKINGSLTPEDEGYVDAFEFYASLPAIISNQTKLENSKRIEDCMEFVDAIIEGVYEESVYEQNAEELSVYMDIVRNIIADENYDPSVEGVAEAIEKFNVVDEYFYKILQAEHKAIISEQLSRFVTTDSYIEKVGICTYLKKYFDENNIDNTDPDFEEYKYLLGVYTAELEDQAIMYKDLIEQNTQYFIDTVKKMNSVYTYGELKPLRDEALSYYYGMNVDSEEVQAAIEKFDEYEEKIRLIEESSQLFLDKANLLSLVSSSKNQDTIFNAIMDAMLYYQYADASYSEEMGEAVESYLKALEAYNSGVDAINSEIDVATAVSCSVRSNEISATVLATINEISKN